jgi:hypothetical protein
VSIIAKSFTCPQRHASRVADPAPVMTGPAAAADDTMTWARSLTEMPAWLAATAYGVTLDEAEHVQAIVADLIAQDEAGR